MKILCCSTYLLFSFLFFANKIYSQYSPISNSVITYNSVCFEFPWTTDAEYYEIAVYKNEPSKKAVYTTKANKIIIDELEFGNDYFWKISSYKKNKELINESAVFKFTIAPNTPNQNFRFLKGITKLDKCGDELMIYDYAGLITDHLNNTIWYLPTALKNMPPIKNIRDLKMTNDGTFLALIDSMAFEFDLNGNILWKAPNTGEVSGMKNEDYHHDIQKLPNGNYMILGNERIRKLFPNEPDSVTFEAGNIIEYSPEGEVVWYWNSSTFFTDQLLAMRKKEDGRVNPSTHMNSFHIDGNSIYVGFRDASWILKLDKPTKKVIEIYGGHDSGYKNHFAKELFLFQHDCELLADKHSMAVINNDSIKAPEVASSMVVFSLGDSQHQKGDELMRFSFKFDQKSNGKSLKLGNVTQLENGNFLINMGALNRIVEIEPNGNVVWDCFTERYDSVKFVWRPFQQYRVATCTSLYPNVFSVKYKTTHKSGTVNLKLTLFNIGSNDQSYEFLLLDRNKETINQSTFPAKQINSAQSANLEFDINLKKASYMLIKAKGTGNSQLIPLD